MNARLLYKNQQSLNRFIVRREEQAKALGKRAIKAARWERGMLLLKSIHAEIAPLKAALQ